MEEKRVRLKPEIKLQVIEQFKKIRENKLLIFGAFIGIVGSLIAGVINDLIRNSDFYPTIYLFILCFILLICISICLMPYLDWKVFQFHINRRIKEMRKLMDSYKNLTKPNFRVQPEHF